MKITKILKSAFGKLFSVAILIIIATGGAYAYKHFEPNFRSVAQENKNIHAEFVMEVYDVIKKNYWNADKTDLETLFEAAINKVSNTTTILTVRDRGGVGQLIASTTASMNDADKKVFVATVSQMVLYNLLPVGRNALYTLTQETAMRKEVSNINESRNLYDVLSVSSTSSATEIENSYKKIAANLASQPKSTTTEEKLKQISYSRRVLTDTSAREVYDTTKVEPTMLIKTVTPGVLYMNMTKFSPTTLNEFANGLQNRAGDNSLKALIIDMRGNIGGAIDYLPYFAGAFIGANLNAYDVYSKGTTTPIKTAVGKFDPLTRFKKVVLLVDGASQSSAEALTASLKRYRAAVVVGSKTRGWGTIENTFPVSTKIDDSQSFTLLLVHSLTVRDDGLPIEENGVIPDVSLDSKSWRDEINDYFNYDPLVKAIESLKKSGPINY